MHGPHAYVSPTWYARPEAGAPTWNCTVTHILGHVRLIEGTGALARLAAEQAAAYESRLASRWRFPGSAPGTERELAGIVGFELIAGQVQIKHKLNQHHDEASRRGAIEGLRARGDGNGNGVEIATMMEAADRRPLGETT